ncbi:hypothetical protein RUND412_000376 [Rhizina undulata]
MTGESISKLRHRIQKLTERLKLQIKEEEDLETNYTAPTTGTRPGSSSAPKSRPVSGKTNSIIQEY